MSLAHSKRATLVEESAPSSIYASHESRVTSHSTLPLTNLGTQATLSATILKIRERR